MGAVMSRWGRVFGVGAGIVMIVGGVLVLQGNRWGYLVFASAGMLLVISPLAVGRRSGRIPDQDRP
jgi:hypothetical protein